MTDDPITAALDQLASQREQITRVDTREATHYATLTGLVAGLTARTSPDPAERTPAATGPTRHRRWWQLAADDRRCRARLRGWVEQVYRPGYGHLAAALGPCWPVPDCACTGSTSPPAVVGPVPPARRDPGRYPRRRNTSPASCPPSPSS